MRITIVLVAVLAAAAWALWPVFSRWRASLSAAPEMQDPAVRLGTKIRVAFSGLKTLVMARVMDGVGLAVPVITALTTWLATEGLDLVAILPPIPIGKGGTLQSTAYFPLILLAAGRVLSFIRTRTTGASGEVDPTLVASAVQQSEANPTFVPSPELAAVAAPETMTARPAGTDVADDAVGAVAAHMDATVQTLTRDQTVTAKVNVPVDESVLAAQIENWHADGTRLLDAVNALVAGRDAIYARMRDMGTSLAGVTRAASPPAA